ncbi:hypothetical protein OK074_5093 [Actinobacteria bacterium OK074]|nr:hypothetical protein OK074_5093 [Actinobacteria bacterium OK074]
MHLVHRLHQIGRSAGAATRLRDGVVTLRFADGSPADTRRPDAAFGMPRSERWTGVTITGGVPFKMVLLRLATFCSSFWQPAKREARW